MTGELRDATGYELAEEPDSMLRAMVDGAIACTETTRVLAKQELDYRRLRAQQTKRDRGCAS